MSGATLPASRLPLLRSALILSVVYIGAALLLWGVSAAGWMPELHDGRGTWKFAVDAGDALHDARKMADVLLAEGWGAWWQLPFGGHARLGSLCLLVFGRSPFAVLPLTLAVFLAIVWLVYRLGRYLFDEPTGRWAGLIVACWPSFLLHSTQLIKDPLYVLGELAFLMAVLLLVDPRTGDGWRVGRRIAGWGLAGFLLTWSVRRYLTEFNLLLWCAGLAVVAILALRRRRVPWAKGLVGVVLAAVFFGLLVDWMGPARRVEPSAVVAAPAAVPEPAVMAPSPDDPCPVWKSGSVGIDTKHAAHKRGVFQRLPMHLAHRRNEVIRFFPTAGSNIDTDVCFDEASDILRYAPRALQIGAAAPFPSMWFTGGQETGRIGRSMAGAETAVMWVLLPLAAWIVWRGRRRPELWMLAAFAVSGMLLLGFVVVNVGVLFRLRYVFWFMAVIPAAHLLAHRLSRRSPA
jgi:4-amino-4-deoxy-L-arabinose transferase-like glycosyltransferase